jgi:hypothetical protein
MLTLDFNHSRGFPETLNDAIDSALTGENAKRPHREYLGGSRVGHACERALQFEFAGAPKDNGADFPGQTLRIFAIGHALEDLAIQWLRAAGVDLYTRKGNRPMASSSVSPSRTAASAVTSTASSPQRPMP